MNIHRRAVGNVYRLTRRSLLAALFVLVLLPGCSGGCKRIAPEGPAPLPPPVRVRTPLLSTLSAPIEIPVDEINALVNKVIPQQLYRKEDIPLKKGLLRARLNLHVQRNGQVRTRTENGQVINSLPLRAEGSVRVPPGITRPFSTTFTIHAVSDLAMDEAWGVEARSRGGFTWGTRPVITVLGIKIDVSKTAGRAINQQLAKLAPRIDGIIAEKVNLRKRVEDIWEKLSDPIALRQEPPIWLLVKPVATFFTPPVSRNDTLVVGLTVQAYLETMIGEEPAAPVLGALPPLQTLPDSLASDSMQTFQIYLPVSLAYADARTLLSRALAERNFDVQDKVALTVRDINLYGHGPRIVARVDFKADVSEGFLGTQGHVYLLGRPVYDVENQTIRVDSFDYDVHSANALAEAADFIYRDDLLEQTRTQLAFPLAENIAAARDQLQAALQDRTLGKHIILDGLVADLLPGEIYLSTEGIHVDVLARGRLSARLRDLDQIKRRRSDSTDTQ